MQDEINGVLQIEYTLQGEIGIPKEYHGYSIYAGDYEIKPKVDAQELQTAKKVMSKNLIIEKIPIYEVSNNLGDTIVIGGEKEYGYQ